VTVDTGIITNAPLPDILRSSSYMGIFSMCHISTLRSFLVMNAYSQTFDILPFVIVTEIFKYDIFGQTVSLRIHIKLS